MLVDYHFHPNLSKYNFLAKRKCLSIWQEFTNQHMDVVVVTEHVFKNPPRAYELLLAARPPDAATVIFPGIEALTSEGIDLIVFAQDERIYRHQKLMVPKQLSLLEMIQYIKQQPDLVASVAHPALFGHSGSERQVGKSITIKAIRLLGGAEIANACFKGSLAFMKLAHMSTFFGTAAAQMAKVHTLPEEYYQYPEVTLYTGGSDAHVTSQIGSGLEVAPAPLTDRLAVWKNISTNTATSFVTQPHRHHPWLAFYHVYTISREALIKALRLYEGRIYQNDDLFTNYYSESEKETVLELNSWRYHWLKPILNFLTYFEVTPHLLNIISVIFIVFSGFWIFIKEPWGVACFLAYLLCNGLTTPLARYQNVETEAGAIIKIILHQFALIVVMFSAMALDWINNWVGALYLVLYIVMIWLIVTLNKIGQPIRFVVRSKDIVLTAIIIEITTNINWLYPVVAGFTIYMALLNGWMLLRLLAEISKRSIPRP
ncbi:MAG: hypothetical protein WCV88_04390 [Patescibacteria group bacterium]|jgi:hypothetical protein